MDGLMDSKLEWQNEYCLGHDVIDSEHKKLFEIANKIFAINNPQTDSKIIEQLIHQLYDYMRYHFGHEEEYMDEVSFEKIEQHKKRHGEIIEEMNKILNESRDFNILELKLVYVMQKWVLIHILEEDLKIKKAIDLHKLKKLAYSVEAGS
jgi:hemerythrin-like metal-binding protein